MCLQMRSELQYTCSKGFHGEVIPNPQSYQTAFAQHLPTGIPTSATTSTSSFTTSNLQICTSPFSVSVNATHSSPNGAGVTAFADPPDVVVSIKNNCFSISPESPNLNALINPFVPACRPRFVAHRYFAECEIITSSGHHADGFRPGLISG